MGIADEHVGIEMWFEIRHLLEAAFTGEIANAYVPLMHRVAVGENVMGGFPISMLIRSAEPCDTQRSRITKRMAEISEIGPTRDRGLEVDDDRARIVAQEKLGQLGVLQPRAPITTNCEQSWQFSGGFLAQRYEVYRLAPLR